MAAEVQTHGVSNDALLAAYQAAAQDAWEQGHSTPVKIGSITVAWIVPSKPAS
jgi:hypothetical protein